MELEEWRNKRQYTIGGSEMHFVVNFNTNNVETTSKFLYGKYGDVPRIQYKACVHGNLFENICRQHCKSEYKFVEIVERNNIKAVSDYLIGLSYSPDGIGKTEDGTNYLLEFKCPFSREIESNNSYIKQEYLWQVMTGIEVLTDVGLLTLDSEFIFCESTLVFVSPNEFNEHDGIKGCMSISPSMDYGLPVHNNLFANMDNIVHSDSPIDEMINYTWIMKKYKSIKSTIKEVHENPKKFFKCMKNIKSSDGHQYSPFETFPCLKNKVIRKRLDLFTSILKDKPELDEVRRILKDYMSREYYELEGLPIPAPISVIIDDEDINIEEDNSKIANNE